MNIKTTVATSVILLVCSIVYVGFVLQGMQNRYEASAAKFRGCRGHRIEGTIDNDPVRFCVTAPQ